MMGKTILVANRKGGVGKTTLVVALAHAFTAEIGLSVCVIDTDPQGSATQALFGPTAAEALSYMFLHATLEGKEVNKRNPNLESIRREQVSFVTNKPDTPLSLVPCSPKLWRIEDKIQRGSTPFSNPKQHYNKKLSKLIKSLNRSYDIIIVDTPPGKTMFSDNLMKTSDLILVPCKPEPVSIWGLEYFASEIGKVTSPTKARWVWTMVSGNVNWQKNVAEFETQPTAINSLSHSEQTDAGAAFHDGFERVTLRQSAQIARAMDNRMPMTFSRLYGSKESENILTLARVVLSEME